MDFFGRKEELNTFKEFYNKDYFSGLIIYGRRRQGKSSLIKESKKYSKGVFIYYQCIKALNVINAKNLRDVLNSCIPNIFLSENITLTEIFDFIFKYSLNNEITLVLDEYSYLNDLDYITSVLQSLIDEYKFSSKLKIVLSGSYVDIMKNLINSKNPLHGRFQYILKIDQFDYYDSSLFYKNLSNEEKINYYAVFGGTPYYLSLIDFNVSFEENLIKLFLKKDAILQNEILTTIQEEYSKIENASYLMSLICSGKHSYSDINSVFSMNVKNSDLSYLLNTLINMGLILKTYSINDVGEKHAYYSLKDNMMKFYFTFVYPNIGFLNVMSPKSFFDLKIKEKLFNYYIPHKFEDICKEYLIKRNLNDDFKPPFEKIGTFSYNDRKSRQNGQFDVVTMSNNYLTFYECKYTNSLLSSNVISSFIESLSKLNIKYNNLGFFSKNGFASDVDKDKYLLFKLDDLFKL